MVHGERHKTGGGHLGRPESGEGEAATRITDNKQIFVPTPNNHNLDRSEGRPFRYEVK